MKPIRVLGQRSYEVYLIHMFVVFILFDLFLNTGRNLVLVPMLFIAVLCVSGVLGELVARFYSEPMNRWLRQRFGDGASRLGSVIRVLKIGIHWRPVLAVSNNWPIIGTTFLFMHRTLIQP